MFISVDLIYLGIIRWSVHEATACFGVKHLAERKNSQEKEVSVKGLHLANLNSQALL